MTIFYKVDPSDARKQSNHFGRAFKTTCRGKSKEVKLRWSKVLTNVANIKGEHSIIWDDDAKIIEKIAADVSNELNVTPSRDFDEMVGLAVHLRKLDSLLCLESVMM